MKQYIKQLACLVLVSSILFNQLQSDDQGGSVDLSNLPPNGYGFLQLLRNESLFSANISFQKEGVNDNLPPGSLVYLKSVSDNKYFRISQDPKTNAVTCVADVTDPKKPPQGSQTEFKVKRYVDYNLDDWITFASDAVHGNVMSIESDENSKTYGKVVFQSSEYEDRAHWTLVPTSEDDANPLASLYLVNASNQGCLHIMTKEEEHVLTPAVTKPTDAVWGVAEWQPAPNAEILKAYWGAAYTLGPDRNSLYSGNNDKRTLHEKLEPAIGDPAGGRSKWLHVLDKYGNEVSGSPFWGERRDVPAAIPPDGYGLYGSYHNDAKDGSLNDITSIAKQWPVSGNQISIPEVLDRNFGGDPISGHKKYIFIVAKNTFGNCFSTPITNHDDDPGYQDKPARQWTLPDGSRPEGQNMVFHREADWTYVATNKVTKVAVYKNNDVWGVTSDKKLVYSKDGATWSDQAVGAIDISVGADGIPWRVGSDNKIYIKSGPSWGIVGLEGKAVHVAARTNEAWAVTDDGKVMQSKNGAAFQNVSFTEGKATALDVTDYDVWVINDQGSLFEYRDNTWKQLPGENLSCIAIQSEKEAWATNKNRQIFHWNGATWTQVGGALTSISISHGTDEVQPAKTEKRTEATAYTVDQDGKTSYPKKPDAVLAIEVVPGMLGIGSGGVKPGSTMAFTTIPISKQPHITGFVTNKLSDFSVSSQIDLVPLLNHGVAWLDQTVTPGKASVSFLANSGSSGNIAVLFGNAISEDALCKVIIGADNNSGTQVQLRTGTQDGEPVFTTVYKVDGKENSWAMASPGNYAPYTVSISDGLLLAFRGDPADGKLIAAYNIPEDDAFKDPTYIGFSSNDQDIQYTEIKVGDPIDVEAPERTYHDDETPVDVAAGTATTWTNFSFRIPDEGSFGFQIKSGGSFSVVFGKDKNSALGHYVINFDKTLGVQKWDAKKRKYIDLITPVDISMYVLNPDADGFLPFWVSYAEGLMIVGLGTIGGDDQVVLTAANDPAAHPGINAFGFSASAGATVKAFHIAPQITVGYKASDDAVYKQPKQMLKFSGDMQVVLPFDYTLKQVDEKIFCADGVTGHEDLVQNTPVPGALYNFIAKLDATGALGLKLLVDPPYNPLQDQMVKDAQNKLIAAQNSLLAAGQTEAAGELQLELAHAKADVDRAKAAAGMQTAQSLQNAGLALMQTAGNIPFPPVAMIGAAAGGAMIAASQIRGGLTEIDLANAAQKELEGAQQLNQAKQAVLQQQGAAAQEQLAAQVETQQAQTVFAEKAAVASTYVDDPTQRQLATQTVPPEALDHQKQLQAMLAAMNAQMPFETLLDACGDMLNVINHPYVTQDEGSKQAVWQWINSLYGQYAKNAASVDADTRKSLMNVLFLALNNPYLIDDKNPSLQGTCYTWINRIVKDVLGGDKQGATIDLQLQYGEYVWIPADLPEADQGAIMFQVMGQNDLWVALSSEGDRRVKGTETEYYEIVLGGWQNTTSAIRLKSMGKSVVEVTEKMEPNAMLDPQEYRTFWINFQKGLITVGHDEPVPANKLFEWQDPYPATGIKNIGLSCWDAPLTVGNISVAPDLAGLDAAWRKLKGEPALEKPVFEEPGAVEAQPEAGAEGGAEAATAEEQQPADAGAGDEAQTDEEAPEPTPAAA